MCECDLSSCNIIPCNQAGKTKDIKMSSTYYLATKVVEIISKDNMLEYKMSTQEDAISVGANSL